MLTMLIIDIGHIMSHEKVEVGFHAFDGTYDPNICVWLADNHFFDWYEMSSACRI